MTEERLREFFAVLERMAAGEVRLRLPITPERDTLDAIAFGVNMMAAELHHTEQELKKARDAAIVANQAKSAYIANLSHEIRTPMTAIMGYLQLVTHFDFSEEKKRDCLVRAEASCKMLLRLIDDALDLAKVESGKFMMEYSLISPANAIREVVASLESIAVIKNVKVEVILSKEVPKEFKTDPLRFKQILVNLLGNAIKFTTEGGIRVLVDGLAGDDSMLVVDVVDTGLGIEPGKLEQLFKPFNQLDSPVAKKLGGSGLGLALSRRFAQSLGGDLALLTSAPGKGSTFRLTLPVLRRDSSDIPSQQFFAAGSYQSIRGTLEGVEILLAEDNQDNQMILRNILENAGSIVTAVEDGRAAIELCADGFDLVLSDLRMPEIGGLEVARALRAKGYRGPLVAISADAMQEHHELARAAGFDLLIAKPVDALELVRVLLSLLLETAIP